MATISTQLMCTLFTHSILTVILFNDCNMKSLGTSSDDCSIPYTTAQIVKSCPKNDIEWKERAIMKNCSAYANMCNGTYLYHCLIDIHLNKLVEVCAKPKVIHLGSCTGISLSALWIIPNYDKNCSIFPENPCPILYNSTKAHQYPGCYELKKPRNETQTTPSNTSSNVTNQTNVYNQNGSLSDHDAMSALTRTLCSLLSLLIIRLH